ncbi:MAG: [Fe-S]-binding protein [Chloroflexi bacterium HGW-Chloroflexi-10]|nr:MAG: [Fe-S]-binding protein [Chloroflexi bacterium HGW-Chloroflexi-10]
MFSLPEKLVLLAAILVSVAAALYAINRIRHSIVIGQSSLHTDQIWKRLPMELIDKVLALRTTWRVRFWANLFHAFIVWGFLFYLLVNLLDFLNRFFPQIHIKGLAGNLVRFGADLISTLILACVLFFVIRRFVIKDNRLDTRAEIMLLPTARRGISRDSLIVSSLIIIHVGSRLLAESYLLVSSGIDIWQPVASWLSALWTNPNKAVTAWHFFSWLSLLSLLVFLPYFPFSKHIHIFFAPLNYLLKPKRSSLAALEDIDFENETLELFGATHMNELDRSAIMDAYACIMCFRCQDVCPPYQTGKPLSPAAYEINKRYALNEMFRSGAAETKSLLEFAIPNEAVWACTACGACVDICPVGVEPMRDILQIRRGLVLMENHFPKPYQLLFRNLERQANPWGIPAAERMRWAEGLSVPTIEEITHPELIWWVGCAGAFDTRAQQTSRAFAQLLNQSGISYAVLGQLENCTGDSARRAGKEDVFFNLAQNNVEILNEVSPKRIVTTCPHCLYALKYEYPAFGGHYDVIHHSQFLAEIQTTTEINDQNTPTFRYHDPCYLARFQHITQTPRDVLRTAGTPLLQTSNSAENTFCCGAGGAQMWKEEEHGIQAVNAARLKQLLETPVEGIITGCPFCKTMLSDAASQSGNTIKIRDIAEQVISKQYQGEKT